MRGVGALNQAPSGLGGVGKHMPPWSHRVSGQCMHPKKEAQQTSYKTMMMWPHHGGQRADKQAHEHTSVRHEPMHLTSMECAHTCNAP